MHVYAYVYIIESSRKIYQCSLTDEISPNKLFKNNNDIFRKHLEKNASVLNIRRHGLKISVTYGNT